MARYAYIKNTHTTLIVRKMTKDKMCQKMILCMPTVDDDGQNETGAIDKLCTQGNMHD